VSASGAGRLAALSVALLLAASASAASAPARGPLAGRFTSSGVELAYELDLPAGEGPFPAVVMGHGSGRTTRHMVRFASAFWNARGFAVLRYDRRGVGDSGGDYVPLGPANSEIGVPELASDMLAGVAFLKTRPEIRASRIGLMGVSQAGWIMVAAAAQSKDVAFVVASVGSPMPVATNTFYERQRHLPIDEGYAALARYDGPAGWDPMPRLRTLSIPVLWFLAENDRLVPTRVAEPRLKEARQAGSRVTVHVYPGGHDVGGHVDLWQADLDAWLRAEKLMR
jgi:dienelactone hydrolase